MIHWLVTNYKNVQLGGIKTLLSAIWEKGLLILGVSSSPPPIATIHKTNAVWASQDYIRVYYGYIGPFFRKIYSVASPLLYWLGTI